MKQKRYSLIIFAIAAALAIISILITQTISFRLQENFCLNNAGNANTWLLEFSLVPFGYSCVFHTGPDVSHTISPGWGFTVTITLIVLFLLVLCYLTLRKIKRHKE